MGRDAFHFDWLTALLLLGIGSFGLFILLTIDRYLFSQQLVYLVAASIILVVVSKIDRAILWWFAPVGYIIAILLVLLPFFGPSIRGSHRWIFVGGMQLLQPSEIIKPLLLLAFARTMASFSPRNIRNVPLLMIVFIIPFLLVFRQPDLGTSLVYGGMWLTMLVASGVSIILLGAASGGMALLAPMLWQLLAAYQKARITTFLNPALDPRGAGYNAVQAVIAVGSGQFFGRGLGRGTQSHLRFLPEFHTDFIFATLVEELGFLGGVALLLCYAFLLWRIIAPLVRGRVQDIFHFAYAVGLFAMLLVQIFINAGMNMGIIPVTGITLPFVSYGGSSLLSIAISFGILWSLAREKRVGVIAIH